MNKQIRLGVVGAGLIWQKAHKGLIEKFSNIFSINAFCVNSQETKNTLQSSYPNVAIHLDYKELLRSNDIDAVLILTPIHLNAVIALAALNAGKDVFVEKPLAVSSKDAQELIDVARSKKRRIFVLENAFYHENLETIKSAIDRKDVGDIVLYERVVHNYFDNNAYDSGGYGKTLWRQEAKFPLGLIFDGGIHLVAAHARIFGNPVSVYATGVKLREGFGEYDEISMFFCYAGHRARGFFSFSSHLPSQQNHFLIRGTTGIIKMENQKLVIEKSDNSKCEIPLTAGSSYGMMWESLAQAIEHSQEPLYTAEQALTDIRVLESVEKSIKTGMPVLI